MGWWSDFKDDVLGLDPNGGGIYDIPVVGDIVEHVGNITDPIYEDIIEPVVIDSFVGNIIAFAFPPAAPFIYAAKAAKALASGNELAALLNAAGGYMAYTSPAATAAVTIGDVTVQGVNANLVTATQQAMAGTDLVTVAKTLAGVGADKAKQVLVEAGATEAAAAEALNTASAELAQMTVSSADAPALIEGMRAAGLDSTMMTEQLANLGVTGTTASDLIRGAEAGFSVGQLESINQGVSFSDMSSANQTQSMLDGGLTQEQMLWDQEAAFTDAELAGWGGSAVPPTAVTPITSAFSPNPTQEEMLWDQEAGFADAELKAWGGSSIPGLEGTGTVFGQGTQGMTWDDTLQKWVRRAESLANVGSKLTGGGSGGGPGGSGGGAGNLQNIFNQADPYWDYRKSVEVPMMAAAAGNATGLSNLYRESYTNPMGAYNTPEMQAVRGGFMDDLERKDAAAGRNTQYGSRAVEAQNNYLSKTLPTYRTGITQGLGTLYNAAKPQPLDPSIATKIANSTAQAQGMAGAQGGQLGNLQRSYDQMTNSDGGTLNQIQGAVNVYKAGKDVWNTGKEIAGWFA